MGASAGSLVTGRFEIFKGDSDGLYCFRYRTSYGACLMESVECYPSRDAALRMIELLQGGVRTATIVDLTRDG